MYGEMVLDSFNLNRPGMIIFRPIMIIRKVKENIIQSSRKRRITRIGTNVFSLGRMIFTRREFSVRMVF